MLVEFEERIKKFEKAKDVEVKHVLLGQEAIYKGTLI
jgi:hypothetical protein